MYNPARIYNSFPNARTLDVALNGAPIPVVKSCKHLGVEIGTNAVKHNVERAAHDMIRRTNLLISNYSHSNWHVLMSLFRTYCCHFYGSPLWKLDLRSIEYLITTWRKCCRKILKVSPRTRSKYLPLLSDMPHPLTQLHVRFLKFYLSCINSGNSVVRYTSALSIESSSNVGFNIRSIFYFLRISEIDCSDDSFILIAKLRDACNVEFSNVSDWDVTVIISLRELLNVRDDIYAIDMNFTRDDLNFFILSLYVGM